MADLPSPTPPDSQKKALEGSETIPAPLPPADAGPKTTGEKGYDLIQFLTGKAFIMAITAVIAYVAKYGKDSYKIPLTSKSAPNYLKQFQEGFEHKLLHNSIYPMAEKGDFAKRLAGSASNTMLLFWGGTAFAPGMREIENNHEPIANWINKHCGKPGEVEICHERLKDEPKQSWGDVLKGRVAGWATVFTSFIALDNALGADKKTGLRWLEKYEEWFGRKLAGLTKAGKEIAKTPVAQKLTEAQEANGLYRFGKIAALDVYATSAAIAIWNMVSRSSSRKRKEQDISDTPSAVPQLIAEIPSAAETETPSPSYANRVASEKKQRAEHIAQHKPSAAFAQKISDTNPNAHLSPSL